MLGPWFLVITMFPEGPSSCRDLLPHSGQKWNPQSHVTILKPLPWVFCFSKDRSTWAGSSKKLRAQGPWQPLREVQGPVLRTLHTLMI